VVVGLPVHNMAVEEPVSLQATVGQAFMALETQVPPLLAVAVADVPHLAKVATVNAG